MDYAIQLRIGSQPVHSKLLYNCDLNKAIFVALL